MEPYGRRAGKPIVLSKGRLDARELSVVRAAVLMKSIR